ncbi:MAG: hypothetical protein A3I09_01795 [Deltaproteobacteria bacterium RIFCSPLOWO2_02_FULL_47_10]|nr:MAG: hypothetical protein A3I09_01795 [Deltaproteobacteria bacterium RIFCSPLOWO2_02_FULL_47_10]
MSVMEIVKKAEAATSPVLAELGYALVDVEYVNDHGRWVLRFYIERNDGAVSIDDCANVSRSLASVLDVENIVEGRYSLEVSSPGLDRPLKRPEDFVRFTGSKARVRTTTPVGGRSNFYGILHGMQGTDILINVDGAEYKVPIDLLSRARIEYK